MAITIKQDFEDYSPAYNPVEVLVESDNDTEDNFKYIFDLYIDGVASYIRFIVAPEPKTGSNFGIKDFSNVLESYVESYILKDYTSLTGGFQYMDKGIKKYHVNYGEEYEVAGVLTQFPDLLVGDDKYIWNASLPYNQWVDFGFNDVDLSQGNGQWLTTQKTKEVSILNDGCTGVIMSDSTDAEYLYVDTYDANGLALGNYAIQNTLSTGTTGSKYLSVSTSPRNLNNISTGLVLGSQPIIDSSVAYYTCEIKDSVLTTVSDGIRFNIVEPCGYPQRRLHFQNKWGAFDSFNFNLVSKESVNIQKKSLKYNPDRINALGAIVYSRADRTNINYHIKSTNQIQLNADYITEEESIWLEELFTSPEIYINVLIDPSKNTYDYVSVSEIQSKKYQIKTDRVDNLFNIDLIITLSNDNYRQRR